MKCLDKPLCHSDNSRSEEEESAFLDSVAKLHANSRFLRVAARLVGMTKGFMFRRITNFTIFTSW